MKRTIAIVSGIIIAFLLGICCNEPKANAGVEYNSSMRVNYLKTTIDGQKYIIFYCGGSLAVVKQ